MGYNYLKQKKILLVDDEAELIRMAESILREDGYTQIRTAVNVREALEICRKWKPECCFMFLDLVWQ